MVWDQLISMQKKHVVMKFLITEGSNTAEIHHRLSFVFGEQTVAHSSVFEWYQCFHEGHESINNSPMKVHLQVLRDQPKEFRTAGKQKLIARWGRLLLWQGTAFRNSTGSFN